MHGKAAEILTLAKCRTEGTNNLEVEVQSCSLLLVAIESNRSLKFR